MTAAAPRAVSAPEAARPRSEFWRGAALALCCALPLAVSLPTLGDKYVIAEDAANAAIWGLGARNLLAEGFGPALRGAKVAPDPGTTGNGVYAHHPPLPVWVMTVPVALGGWEGWARLAALSCTAATLALLARVLRRFFEPNVALAAVAAAAASGFALHSGRMLTTLTLGAPLFLALLDAGLAWCATGKLRWWASPAAALLILSSWDGWLGAGALGLAALASARGRRWRQLLAPSFSAAAAAAFVAWHLVDATGGTAELAWQATWRATPGVPPGDWLAYQWNALLPRLGPLALLALAAAPFLARGLSREAKVALLVAAAPGVGMLLIFRQGAFKHPFWGYQLLFPAAFALALALSRLGRRARAVALVALAAQGAVLVGWSSQLLETEHTASSAARLLTRHFTGATEVPMLTPGRFHPWVPWNVGAGNVQLGDVAALDERLASGWSPERPVLVDTRLTQKLGCGPLPEGERSDDGRWLAAPLGAVRARCARGISRFEQPTP